MPAANKRFYEKRHPLPHRNSCGVQPATGLRMWKISFTSSCASLARGYPHSRPTVLLLKNNHAKDIHLNMSIKAEKHKQHK